MAIEIDYYITMVSKNAETVNIIVAAKISRRGSEGVAEGVGLEPTSPLRSPSFRDWCLTIRRTLPCRYSIIFLGEIQGADVSRLSPARNFILSCDRNIG